MNPLLIFLLLTNCCLAATISSDASSQITSTQSPTTTSNTPEKTSNLPTLILTPAGTLVWNYTVIVGSETLQTLAPRLDIQNPDVFLLDNRYFTMCTDETTTSSSSSSASSSSSSETTIKKKKREDASVTSSSAETSSTITTTSSSSSSSSSYSTSFSTVSRCASQVYFMTRSSQSAYWSTTLMKIVDGIENATEYYRMLMNYIWSKGRYQVDDFIFEVDGIDDSKSSQNVNFTDFVFVGANASNVPIGSLGIGTPMNGGTNLISRFVEGKYISSNSYSLRLTRNEGDSQLVLGGINKNHYIGNLTVFDFIPVYDPTYKFVPESLNGISNTFPVLPISRFGVTSNPSGDSVLFNAEYSDTTTHTGTYPRAAVLDSRTFFNYIPYSTLIEIAIELNAYYVDSFGAWLVDCTIKESGTIDMYFGDLEINIPIGDLLMPATDENGTQLTFENGNEACILRVLPDYSYGYSLLGTPFLKSVFLAVDHEGRQLAIANLNDTDIESPSDNEDQQYEITSGYIPFAITNNLTSYAALTLTVPSSTSDVANYTGPNTADLLSNGDIIRTEGGTNAYSANGAGGVALSGLLGTTTNSNALSASGYTGTSSSKGGAAAAYGGRGSVGLFERCSLYFAGVVLMCLSIL
ncbi:unnamed protein product [Ambrosiozyma monospora]|uniref:Unnamed protein product n=1 Tax=Ambrosiozyma monospora TaxID=43982 RepID=A0A9W6YL15_AMBMO|nr:unnamed protein product [Ambrosiozyma monospora]